MRAFSLGPSVEKKEFSRSLAARPARMVQDASGGPPRLVARFVAQHEKLLEEEGFVGLGPGQIDDALRQFGVDQAVDGRLNFAPLGTGARHDIN